MTQLRKPLIVYLPDTRGVEISRYGRSNLKLGADVFTYSRVAGSREYEKAGTRQFVMGTCPGATPECEEICYAKRICEGPVARVHNENSCTDDVPPIPEECKTLRLHVSGDFNSVIYVRNWIAQLTERPDVTCWAYTRSWRVPELLPHLEVLRALPNVQLFASMDRSHDDVPPAGWRRAWIDGDTRAGTPVDIHAHADVDWHNKRNARTFDGAMSYTCPEETKHVSDCLTCGYCFEGRVNDVTFLRH